MKKIYEYTLYLLLLHPLLLSASSAQNESSSKGTNSPVTFLENKGQWQSDILFRGLSTAVNVYLLKDGLSFAQQGKSIKKAEGAKEYPYMVWNMKFVNINESLKISGSNGKKSVISFLYGKDSSKWVINPNEFTLIKYKNIYNDIDLEFYGEGFDLKYDFIIRPGADLLKIAAYYEGIENLFINSEGELEVKNMWNTQVQKKPVAWQVINGKRNYIEVHYKILNDTTFGFDAVNGYDKNYELIIDPLYQMIFSSYTRALGGSNNINYCFANAMDNEGNVYLTGMVDGTYPITPGAYSGPGSIVPEIFVSKFSSDGSILLYSTYISGTSTEHGIGIAVDDIGRAHITGFAMANFTGGNLYPTTPNAYQGSIFPSGGDDVVFTVLNPSGTGLVYSTFLGGSNNDKGYDIKLGNDGMVYITGVTTSTNFPLKTSGITQTGNHDVFVAKFDITQSGANSLVYSVRIGGSTLNSGQATGRSLAVNDVGNVFVTGTYSNGNNSPPFYPTTTGAFNTTYNSGNDNSMAFITKLSATTPVTIEYSTFLGPGSGNSIDVDPVSGNEVYVTGNTRTFSFPTTSGVLQPVHGQDALGNPNNDAFIIKLNSTGSSLMYSTFLGGEIQDIGTGIAVNSVGEVHVAGRTGGDFPVSPGSFQPIHAGSSDFFVAHLNSDATAFACGGSTYVGGTDSDYHSSQYDYPSPIVSLKDNMGINDTVSLSGTSHSQDFPTTPGAYEPNKVNGIADQPVFFKLTSLCTVNPIVNFNFTITGSCDTVSVDFTDATINNPTSWQWVFNGATPAVSILQNPQGIAYTTPGIYDVTLIACNSFSCDTLTSTIEIILGQNITFNLGNDTTLCQENSINLSAPTGFANYTWQLNGNTIGNNSNINVSQQGMYIINIEDSLGCTGSDTINVNLSNPSVTLGSDINICNEDSALINASPGFLQYTWTLNGNNIPVTGNSFYANETGNYSVIVTDSVGCTATDSILITVFSPEADLGPDLAICGNDSVLISTAPGLANYQWMLNGSAIPINTNTFYVNKPGTYSVIVVDINSCTATDEIIIQELAKPEAAFNYTTNLSCTGIELSTDNKSKNSTSYQWILNNGQTFNTENFSFNFESLQNMTLQLVAFNDDCSDTLIVENITFNTPLIDTIPNIITPNSDGTNDCFEIHGIEQLSECTSLNVFNRWGILVYSEDRFSNCWNGINRNNTDLSAGVYFYVLTIKDLTYNGVIHIIR